MTKKMTDPQNYTDIANAIRAKGGTTEQLKPSQMAAAIAALPSGGGTNYLEQRLKGTLAELTDDVVGSATVIPEYSFSWLTALRKVSLSNVTEIGDYAFRNTYSSIVNLPSVTYLGASSFYGTRIRTIELPSATSISMQAFQRCTLLSIALLPSATYIGFYAFAECNRLNTLVVGTNNGGEVCELEGSLMPSVSSGLTIYVPDALVDSYKTATNWSLYADYIKGISEKPA